MNDLAQFLNTFVTVFVVLYVFVSFFKMTPTPTTRCMIWGIAIFFVLMADKNPDTLNSIAGASGYVVAMQVYAYRFMKKQKKSSL